MIKYFLDILRIITKWQLQFISDSINYLVIVLLLVWDLSSNNINFYQWSVAFVALFFGIYTKLLLIYRK